VDTVRELSHARSLDEIMRIVRTAARELTGADGASFVLRDGDKCFYADEDAVAPLWKGQRFPMRICVSGWVMLNKAPAVIEDIFVDPRVPADAYRPTFVKSMAMVPIRRDEPLGAIGNYWARTRKPLEQEVEILQALAAVTSVAIENVSLYEQLQGKIRALEQSNGELARFAWITSHDLKSPLRAIHNLSQWIEEDLGAALDEKVGGHLRKLRGRIVRMDRLLDDTLGYARMEGAASADGRSLVKGAVLADDALALIDLPPGFAVRVSDRFKAALVPRMPLQQILCNLVDNAIHHHDGKEGVIAFDAEEQGSHYRFTVSDDGPGVAPEYREKIFGMFERLKSGDAKQGSGMGLAIVRKALRLHGGEIEVYANTPRGAVFAFTWPRPLPSLNVAE
jgi:signal transduction histidine kinase